ncbi:MAG: hypothetical protein HFP77_08920 [Methylococcales symbiont of Iophon sp. n. MRB-2018]|nr:MAG: hypothetical protein HFP77_08920 [Methylococcales symbiont of Iophon sp. n. MRB-2018]KAF3979329.1 MAG: hypothetical protein HFP76_07750 [Methylococcales symbiont of Iophon sp. n. MRB-2018]
MLLGCRSPVGYIPAKHSFWFSKKLNQAHRVRIFAETTYGTHGYCLNNRGARKLIPYLQAISRPIDHFMNNDKYINLYAVQNPVILSDEISAQMSAICADREEMFRRYPFILPKTPLNKLITFLKSYLFSSKLRDVLGTKQFIALIAVFL